MLRYKNGASAADAKTNDLEKEYKLVYQPDSGNLCTAERRDHNGIRNINRRRDQQLKSNG